MNIMNNNISFQSVNFGSLPFYSRGKEVDKTELISRDAEYSKMVDRLETETFEPRDMFLIRTVEDSPEDVSVKLKDIDTERKLQEMLMMMRKNNSQVQPSSTPSRQVYGPHILDIKA